MKGTNRWVLSLWLSSMAAHEAAAQDWRVRRGTEFGDMVAPGVADLDGSPGHKPYIRAVRQYATDGYDDGSSWLGDFRPESSGLEVLGITQGHAVLWSASGVELARSETITVADPIGIYDLDGDGVDAELVVAGGDVGGGLVVLDAATLGELWRSADVTGMNAGVIADEVAIGDLNDDGAAEIVWGVSFYGYPDLYLANFADDPSTRDDGVTNPSVTTIEADFSDAGGTRLDLGAYVGDDGVFDDIALVVGRTLRMLSVVEGAHPDAAACDERDATLCLGVVSQGAIAKVGTSLGLKPHMGRVDLDGDGDDERVYVESGAARIGVLAFDPELGYAAASPTAGIDAGRLWYIAYRGSGAATPAGIATADSVSRAESASHERVVAFSMSNVDFTSEGGWDADLDWTTPWDAAEFNDCLGSTDASGAPITLASLFVDGKTGKLLATDVGSKVVGVVDADGNGVRETVLTRTRTVGTTTSYATEGVELDCGSANVDDWSSCSATGCTLSKKWSIPTLINAVPRNPHGPFVDLNGDGHEEVIALVGPAVRAYEVYGHGSTPATLASYALASNPATQGCGHLTQIVGSGTEARLLFDGSTCFNVLNASMVRVGGFVVPDNQGFCNILTARLSGGRHLAYYALPNGKYGVSCNKAYGDATAASAVPDLSLTAQTFADVDGDGVDESIAFATETPGAPFGAGRWELSVRRWDGTQYAPYWTFGAADVGDTTHRTGTVTVGDFDADGDPDIALAVGRFGVLVDDRVWMLDGQGQMVSGTRAARVIRSLVASPVATQMLAANLHDGWPGDELMVSGPDIDPGSRVVYGVQIWNAASTLPVGTIDVIPGGMSVNNDASVAQLRPETSAVEVIFRAETSGVGFRRVAAYSVASGLLWRRDLPNFSGSTSHIATSDMNDDGIDDVVRVDAYGGLFVYNGVDGSPFSERDGYPVYLLNGSILDTRPVSGGRHIHEVVLADIDGDTYAEALVAHDDGRVYAVNLAMGDPDGAPSLLWTIPFGSPVLGIRAFDADDDGLLEVMALPFDGRSYLIDKGVASVERLRPADDVCITGSTYEVSGTATGVDQVEVVDNCDSSHAVRVPVTSGRWSVPAMPWMGRESSSCVVVLNGWSGGVRVVWTSFIVAHSFDDDDDGFSPLCGDIRDCDDADADIYPGAPEVSCDGIDQDCDGRAEGTDDRDRDLDDFTACDDCDDANSNVNPDAPEIPYNAVDDDCVGGDWLDVDGDGFMADVEGLPGTDCDDDDAEVRPGAIETPDGVDEDCDGEVDEGTTNADDDGDGWTEAGGDCADNDPEINPSMGELLDDVDENCDGRIDDGTLVFDDDEDGAAEVDGDCNDHDPSVVPTADEPETRTDGVDEDCDGNIDDGTAVSDDDYDGWTELGGDCDDADGTRYPGATEILDGADQDCDELIDEGFEVEVPDPLDTDVPPFDTDVGLPIPDETTDDDGDGYSEVAGDCDDAAAGISPGREERCTVDGFSSFDENCDGLVDEGCDDSDVVVAPAAGCGCEASPSGPAGVPLAMAWLLIRWRRAPRRRPAGVKR